nr:hypothetical protein [Tanacetum cinerariifolium]
MRRFGKGFSRVETPLFENMLAVRAVDAEEEVQVPAQDDVVQEHVATEVVPPTPTSPSPSSPVLDKCSALVLRIEGLETANAAQQLEIIKLKDRVKKLESLNKVKSSKLRRLKKVGTSQRIESSDEVENVFNQGRMSVDMETDEGVELVLSMQEDTEVQEAVEVVTTAKLITETREETEKEDEKIIKSINETPAQKAAKRRKLSEEAQEANDLRRHLEIVQDEDDDVFVEAIPLAQKVLVVDYQVVVIDNKPKYKIIRADDSHQFYISFTTLLKNFDREDLETLWRIVKDRFSTKKPTNFSDEYLLLTLKTIFRELYEHDAIWKNQKSVHGLALVKRWKLLTSCGVHVIILSTV